MKQNFTILWIEDKESVIDSQISEIKEFLDGQGYELNLLKDITGKKFEEHLEKQPIDIIVTDYNISEKIKGNDIIKNIRKKNLLTDILFYSVIDKIFKGDKIYSELGYYGLVDICKGKDVIKPLKKLIVKNIKRCEDIVFLRGAVISRSIELELKINESFAKYFKIPSELEEDFHSLLLENKFIPMAGKKYSMGKILSKTGLKENPDFSGLLTKLDDIIKERNLLAHCKKDKKNPNVLVSSGESEIFDKKRLNGILDKIKKASQQLDKLIETFST